jgi:acetylornithine/succinyldiaminopimelate/putrescine aminotransferase
MLAFHNAYHGSTHGALSVMGSDYFKQGYGPLLPDVGFMQYNDFASLDAIDGETACVIVETIQGEAGAKLPDSNWLQELSKRCRENGSLLILDEIQAGCGRTGTLFAFEQYDVQPDILLLAKGFGGGMPIGAFVAPQRIMQVLSVDPPLGHITTFGGHPVCAAAALATLQPITEPGLLEAIPAKERLFRALLTHPAVKDIRSAGLWLAVDLDDAGKVQRGIRRCLDLGVVTDWFLFNDRSLRIAPPLVIREEEIRFACGVLLEALE